MLLTSRIIPPVRELLKLLEDLPDQAPHCRVHQLEASRF